MTRKTVEINLKEAFDSESNKLHYWSTLHTKHTSVWELSLEWTLKLFEIIYPVHIEKGFVWLGIGSYRKLSDLMDVCRTLHL